MSVIDIIICIGYGLFFMPRRMFFLQAKEHQSRKSWGIVRKCEGKKGKGKI